MQQLLIVTDYMGRAVWISLTAAVSQLLLLSWLKEGERPINWFPPSYCTHPTSSSGEKTIPKPSCPHTHKHTHFSLLKWFTERHPMDHIPPNEKLCRSRSAIDAPMSAPVFSIPVIRLPFCRTGLLLRKAVNYISSIDQSLSRLLYLALLPHSFTLLCIGFLAWVIDHSLPKVVPTWSNMRGSTKATHFSDMH